MTCNRRYKRVKEWVLRVTLGEYQNDYKKRFLQYCLRPSNNFPSYNYELSRERFKALDLRIN